MATNIDGPRGREQVRRIFVAAKESQAAGYVTMAIRVEDALLLARYCDSWCMEMDATTYDDEEGDLD